MNCDYENCMETRLVCTLQSGGERKVFCCNEHAGFWLLNRAWRASQQRPELVARFRRAIRAEWDAIDAELARLSSTRPRRDDGAPTEVEIGRSQRRLEQLFGFKSDDN